MKTDTIDIPDLIKSILDIEEIEITNIPKARVDDWSVQKYGLYLGGPIGIEREDCHDMTKV